MAQPPRQLPPEPNAPQYSPRLRATAVLVVVVCLFAALFGRLWYLQGVEANTVAAKSVAGQGIETVYVPAPRGDIFDRDGVLLAGNKIEPVVTVAPGAEAAHPGIVGELSALLGEPISEVKAAINNVQYSPYQPVPVKVGVSNAVVLAIDENQSLLPGVTVQAEPVRYYPEGETTANIVGYISTITGPEYAQVKNEQCGRGVPCYQTTSLIGQGGVEASFEDYVRGTPGVEKVEVDSQGQVLGLLSYRPPVPGDNLVLSISLTDQRAAVQALNDWVIKARGMTDSVSGQLSAPRGLHGGRRPPERPGARPGHLPRLQPGRLPRRHQRGEVEVLQQSGQQLPPYRQGHLDGVRAGFYLEADHGHGHASLQPALACKTTTTTPALTRPGGRPSMTTTTWPWAR